MAVKAMTPAKRKKALVKLKQPLERRRPRKLQPEDVALLLKTYPEVALILARARAFITADGRIAGGDGDLWQAGCEVPFTAEGRAWYAEVRRKG